jgi:hypothetical protein
VPLGIGLSGFHDGALAGWLTDLLGADWDSLSKHHLHGHSRLRVYELDECAAHPEKNKRPR